MKIEAELLVETLQAEQTQLGRVEKAIKRLTAGFEGYRMSHIYPSIDT